MRILIFFVVSLLISTVQSKLTAANDLLKSEQEIIAWLDKLGHSDLSQASVVNVATGNWSKTSNEPEKNSYLIGFLTAEDGADFTVVDLTGKQTTYSKKEGTDNGVELAVEWIDKPQKRGGSQQMWNMRVNVMLGEKHLNNSSGSSSLEYATQSKNYDSLRSR